MLFRTTFEKQPGLWSLSEMRPELVRDVYGEWETFVSLLNREAIKFPHLSQVLLVKQN